MQIPTGRGEAAAAVKILMAAGQFCLQPETAPVFAAWLRREDPAISEAEIPRALAEGALVVASIIIYGLPVPQGGSANVLRPEGAPADLAAMGRTV